MGKQVQELPGELTSWKEIAAYLGVNVRTAQKWESERGLPVRRLGGERGRVIATLAELEQWKQAAQRGPGWWHNRRFFQVYAAALTALAAIAATAAAARWLARRPGPPVEVRVETWSVAAFDEEGRERWRHRLEQPVEATFYDVWQYPPYPHPAKGWIGDLDGDGTKETLFVHATVDHLSRGVKLDCLTATGRPAWSYQPRQILTDRGRTFGPPYHWREFRVIPGSDPGRETRIVATFVHGFSYPSFAVALDARGNVRGEYRHAGHLNRIATLDLDRDGDDEVLLGGMDWDRQQAKLVALDGYLKAEKAVLWFPRTRVNKMLERFNLIGQLDAGEDGIRVTVRESIRAVNPFATYVLDRNLNVQGIEVEDGLQRLYDQTGGLPDGEMDRLRRGVEAVRR